MEALGACEVIKAGVPYEEDYGEPAEQPDVSRRPTARRRRGPTSWRRRRPRGGAARRRGAPSEAPRAGAAARLAPPDDDDLPLPVAGRVPGRGRARRRRRRPCYVGDCPKPFYYATADLPPPEVFVAPDAACLVRPPPPSPVRLRGGPRLAPRRTRATTRARVWCLSPCPTPAAPPPPPPLPPRAVVRQKQPGSRLLPRRPTVHRGGAAGRRPRAAAAAPKAVASGESDEARRAAAAARRALGCEGAATRTEEAPAAAQAGAAARAAAAATVAREGGGPGRRLCCGRPTGARPSRTCAAGARRRAGRREARPSAAARFASPKWRCGGRLLILAPGSFDTVSSELATTVTVRANAGSSDFRRRERHGH